MNFHGEKSWNMFLGELSDVEWYKFLYVAAQKSVGKHLFKDHPKQTETSNKMANKRSLH
jgi:hypothetical protein